MCMPPPPPPHTHTRKIAKHAHTSQQTDALTYMYYNRYYFARIVAYINAIPVWPSAGTVRPVTNDHPLGLEKAVFSGRWSLVRGLHRTTIYMNVRPSVPGKVVCSSRLVASHGGLYLQVLVLLYSLYAVWTV